MRDTAPWFTLWWVGHVPLTLDDEPDDLELVRAGVEKDYPYVVELPVGDAPLMPTFIFDVDKRAWTSFFSRETKMVYFAFSDVKDAVECRLRI